eukprot:346090-Chlamydomonas_euryale.AAC.6
MGGLAACRRACGRCHACMDMSRWHQSQLVFLSLKGEAINTDGCGAAQAAQLPEWAAVACASRHGMAAVAYTAPLPGGAPHSAVVLWLVRRSSCRQ